MCDLTTRVVVDDGTEFSPSVELCLAEVRRGRARLIAISGQLMSHADIDGMVATVIYDIREWRLEAKAQLDAAQAQAARDGVPQRQLALHTEPPPRSSR